VKNLIEAVIIASVFCSLFITIKDYVKSQESELYKIIKEQEYQRQEIRKLDLRNEETRLFVNWTYRDLNGINDMPDNSPIFLPQIPVKYCDVCHFQPAQGAR
jgi:hypothetical protein